MEPQYENVYELFFNNSDNGMIIFNTRGKIVKANVAAHKLLKYDTDQLIEGNINEVIPAHYRDQFRKICNALIKGTEGRQGKMLLIPDYVKNDKESAIGIYLNNHILFNGKPLIAAMLRDETERWKDKEELKQSHERFKKVFHNNPVAQFIASSETREILDINEKFLELSGYQRTDVLGKDIEAIGLTICGDKETGTHTKIAKNGNARRCESEWHIAGGKTLKVLQSHVQIMAHDKYHQLWTIVDLTALKEAQTHLENLNRELEQKVQERTMELTELLQREKSISDMKSRFVSTASHEFRTPLTAILASTGLLETYIGLNNHEKCAIHIKRIKSSVKILTELLEDFLSLDKIDQGNVKYRSTNFDLREFGTTVINEMNAILKKGQVIEYNLQGGPFITFDEAILKNITRNLLSNASKYSAENQVITWSVSIKNEKLVLSVADSGIGIPEEDKPYIFSRFFRAKNAEVIQGTGLGLNIVKKYVELFKGKISFVSVENAGSTFIVELPFPDKR